WLARYENGWNKLKTDLLNSTATVNYYRAYTNAFSYFAIVGEKAQAPQTSPPAVETPKKAVKEETTTTTEQPKEPDASAVEEQKDSPSYIVYLVAVIILLVAAYAATKIKATKEDKAPRNEHGEGAEPEPKRSYHSPVRNLPEHHNERKKPKADEELDDIQKRIEGIKKKIGK
ncbi:MAG: PGF-pre-PGF domain-containing protein, partial [Nanoarchaeota archaeon]